MWQQVVQALRAEDLVADLQALGNQLPIVPEYVLREEFLMGSDPFVFAFVACFFISSLCWILALVLGNYSQVYGRDPRIVDRNFSPSGTNSLGIDFGPLYRSCTHGGLH
jgi:hypothetical protein